MNESLMPFFWVAMTLPILLIMQRWIHRHLHGLAFLLTGNKNWAIVLYAIILFPGVLLHEFSHWITAAVLGVRTGTLSLLPRAKPDGTIQLGYVEYYRGRNLGPIRESLIGSAPLIAGTVVTLLLGFQVFDLPELAAALQAGNIDILARALGELLSTEDFFVWLYLFFAISNAMMPSDADRRAWPAFALLMIGAALILYVLGLRDLLLFGIDGPLATVFGYIGLAFSLTIGVDLFFMLFIHLLEALVSRFKGIELVYSNVDTPPSGRS